MHISKINGKYPIAFKPNNVMFRTKGENSALERQLMMVLFVAPAIRFPENREITIDVNMITNKPLHGSICTRIRKALDNITDAKFEIYYDSTHYKFINVFESAERRGSKITAIITKSAIDTIKTCLPRGFTKIPIEDSIRLTTGHQFVFLELLIKHKRLKHSAISIAEIKRYTSIEDKYDRWDNFRQRVANPSINGLNKNLGYNIKLIPSKVGNRTNALTLCETKNRIPPKDVSTNVNVKTLKNKDNDKNSDFEFASVCFKMLPLKIQEQYKKGYPQYYGNEVITTSAANDFLEEFDELLKRSESPEEFIREFQKNMLTGINQEQASLRQ